ncbi:hypothetical protein Cgig2_019818 [Carnegiea gigantea]|uniref:Transposase MuDR plant domain-containing protein n=1 Tax=Carnegiea gigantea TaxID=171969 RepID=A0A9Q1Q9R4_9CARY|nr:hypothetical protein Cgig2_019818 [Carnegiea gigantea]
MVWSDLTAINYALNLGELKRGQVEVKHVIESIINDIVVLIGMFKPSLGYTESIIEKIYFKKPKLEFKDSLVSIETDEEVHELIVLYKSFDYVSLYVEHDDEVWPAKSVNNDNESDDGHSYYMVDDKYDDYGSDVKDEEVAQNRAQKKKEMHDEVVADLEGPRNENKENWGKSNAFDDMYVYYQDSNDANSSVISESDDDDVGKGRKKKKKRAITYSQYNTISSNKGAKLELGRNFIDNEELRKAIENYCIMKGYDIRITHTNRNRFPAFCNGEGLCILVDCRSK